MADTTWMRSDPLDVLVDRWRRAPDGCQRFVPEMDPFGGRTRARLLVLMQSPAAVTVAQGAAAVCGEDSPSRAVQLFVGCRKEAGLDRTDYLRWNVIPWAIPAAGAVRKRDLDEARPALHDLLTVLADIEAVVTLGSAALEGYMRYATLHPDPVVRPVLAAPHPSPANGAHRTEQRVRIVNALTRAIAPARSHHELATGWEAARQPGSGESA